MTSTAIVREFDASRAEVWQAWTDPAMAAQWWHPHGATTKAGSVRIDAREGGTFATTMLSADGRERPTGGEYLEVHEPARLRCSWGERESEEGPMRVITVDLVETAADRTRMRVEFEGLEDDRGAPDSVLDGWDEAFDALESTLDHLH